jgi:hypothetical protein
MVEGQASDLYASDTDNWFATSTVQGLDEESPMDSHFPLWISQSLGVT